MMTVDKGMKNLYTACDSLLSSELRDQLTKRPAEELQFQELSLLSQKGLRLVSDEEFWVLVEHLRTPLLEKVNEVEGVWKATFLVRQEKENNSSDTYSVVGPFNNYDSHEGALRQIHGTNVYATTYLIPEDAVFRYSIVRNRTDRRKRGVTGDEQVVDLYARQRFLYENESFQFEPGIVKGPKAPYSPWTKVQSEVPEGTLSHYQLKSALQDINRTYTVYTPHSYSPDSTYPFCLFFDGRAYTSPKYLPTPTILDNLIAAEKVPPMVGIFVQNVSGKRSWDLGYNPVFIQSIVEELLTEVRENFSISDKPQDGLTCGSSYGGLAALYASYLYPNIFGKVLTQCGQFKGFEDTYNPDFNIFEVLQHERNVKRRCVIQVGRLDRAEFDSRVLPICLQSPALHKLLLDKGHESSLQEWNGDHSYVFWREILADGLITAWAK